MRRLYHLLLLLSGTVLPVYAEDAPDAIEACIRANLPESTSRQSIELKSRDRTGYEQVPVSYTHLTLPTRSCQCRCRWWPAQ